jgi:hypothetical protein
VFFQFFFVLISVRLNFSYGAWSRPSTPCGQWSDQMPSQGAAPGFCGKEMRDVPTCVSVRGTRPF